MKAGIDVPNVIMIVYVIAGAMADVAGIIMTSWVSAATPVDQSGLTLQSIAAVVLGGVVLTDGAGGMRHVLHGVIILGAMSNALNILGISSYYQILTVAAVIIAAVSLDVFRNQVRV